MRTPKSAKSRTAVAILVVVSGAALFAPASWTGRLISLIQPLVPLQHGEAMATHAVAGAFRDHPDPVSAEQYGAMRLRQEGLKHQVAALTARVAELESEVGILTATRLRDIAGGGIGTRGRLVPARVITGDLLPWRSSRLINAGTLQGVRAAAPVVSDQFSIEPGREQGIRDGLVVLLGEVLVGFVAQVGTHTARVKLISDVSIQMKCRIGRFEEDGTCRLMDDSYWIYGRGNGRMEIRDVDRRDVEAGVVQVGDVVLSDPRSAQLPAAMTMGTVRGISPARDKPLFSILVIKSEPHSEPLDRVYVFDPQTEPQ